MTYNTLVSLFKHMYVKINNNNIFSEYAFVSCLFKFVIKCVFNLGLFSIVNKPDFR